MRNTLESKTSQPRDWLLLPTICGSLAMAVGGLVIIGWFADWPAVVQLLPDLPSMKFNTALGMLLCGLGLLCLPTRFARLASWLGYLVTLLGVLSLAEYITGISLGIDQFFVNDFVETSTAFPGRMSPLSASCFVLIGLALGMTGGAQSAKWRLTAVAVLTSSLAVIVCVALLGYVFGIQSASGWGAYTRMAVHTAATFLILSAGLLMWVRDTADRIRFDFVRWLPASGSVTLMVMAAIVSMASFNQLEDSTSWRKHSYDLLATAQTFLDDYMDIQRGMRGYVLTGQHSALVTHEAGLNDAPKQLAQLRALASDNPEQEKRLRVLAEDLDHVIAYDRKMIETRDSQGVQAALQIDITGEGIALANRTVADFHAFTDAEHRLLEERSGAADANFHYTVGLVLFGSGLAVLLLILTNFMAGREMHRRGLAEARLHEVAALQEAILNSTDFGIIATDAKGIVTSFNATAARWLGYSADEIIGKSTPEIWHDSGEIVARASRLSAELGRKIEPGFEVFTAKVSPGKPDQSEWTYIHKDGGRFPVWLSATALTDMAGQVIGYLGVVTDLTERKKAQEDLRATEERFRLIVDAVEDYALFMLDPRGCVASWNVGAERINGYTAKEIIGKHFSLFYLPEDIERRHPEEELRIAAETGRYVEEGWRVRKNGTRFLADVVITAIKDDSGKLHGFAKITRDITRQKDAEKKLQDQALILDLANDTIFIRDCRDRITYWNRGAERLYGWSKEVATGRVTHDLLKTKFPQPLDVINAQLLATGHWEGELVHTKRDLSLVTVASSWTLQRDDLNQPSSVIEMNFDISARKKVEEELASNKERLNTILNSSLDGVVVYQAVRDDHGVVQDFRFELVNPATEKLMGIPAAELLGHNLLQVAPNAIADGLFENFLRIVDKNEKLDFEYQSNRGFPPRWYRVAGVKLGDGIVLSYADVTARKQYEQELQAAKERAESADNAKSNFLANMSHEIRTPMNGVIGMTGLLLDTRLDAEQRNLAETIQTSGESLLSLINDILDFSKIEAGKLSFEEMDFDLRKVMEDTVELLAAPAHAKGLELIGGMEPDVPAKLRGDPSRVRQVLTNLIGNAIKFTASGEVSLRVSTESETENDVLVRFEIKDSGVGISREVKARLFQPFIQADTSTARMFGGTGLGLAICKRLAESMHGDIGVESYPGKGSKFWVTMRFCRQPDAKAEDRNIPEFVDARVLLVDDNKTSLQCLHEQLVAWRMQNGSAASGAQALAMLRQAAAGPSPYQVAIIDLNMPELDGLEVARKIKEDSQLVATKIILLTPFRKSVIGEELKTVDVTACCVKPVRQSALFDCLVLALGRSTVPAATREASAPSVTTTVARKERVLLAEDNVVNQRVALGNLEKLGYSADVVTNGIEVLEALEAQTYDIILMDCQMPDLDGYQTTTEIRRREKGGRHAWIIAMTANVMMGDREKCLSVGMDDYVSKPLRRSELRAALARVETGCEPVVDEGALQKMRDSGEDDFSELIELFIESAPSSVKDMQRALKEGNAKALSMAAHTLKGSCSNLGDSPLRELCAEIEKAGRNGEIESVASRVASVEAELYRFIEALAPYRKPKTST